MPLPLVSPTLLNAHALAADFRDTHAQPGNHVRVNAHPLLGLPVAPYFVWRAVVREVDSIKKRSAATFVDSRGRVLSTPFTVTPDNPVTAHIALRPGETCIWARLLLLEDDGGVKPGSVPNPGEPARPSEPVISAPPFDTAVPPRVVAPIPQPGRTTRQLLSSARIDGSRGVRDLLASGVKKGLQVRAFVSSARGPAEVARRSEAPYAFGAPGIVSLELRGSGAVRAVQWLEQSDVRRLDFEPWQQLNLPHVGGPRYIAPVDPLARAAARVLDQAPKRLPLQETLGILAPASVPMATADKEGDRVKSLVAPLASSLDALITDVSQSPFDQLNSEPVFDESGVERGTAEQSRLAAIYQGQLDPGCAAFFGCKARDSNFVETEPTLVFYWVAGFFRDFPPVPGKPPADPSFDALIAQLPSANRTGDDKTLVDNVRRLMEPLQIQLSPDADGQVERHRDYIGLGAMAVADRSAPPDPVPPADIISHEHVGWIPTVVVPDARREVQLSLANVGVGHLLAAEKQTPATGAQRLSLNKRNDDGYHLPLALGLSATDATLAPSDAPGTGIIGDRLAEPVDIRYSVAQQDRFARWSAWTSVVNAPGSRPRPPRPVFRATYTQPANPASGGGTVRVIVDVPTLDTLSPAAFPIARLQLTYTDRTTGGVITLNEVISNPLAPPTTLDFSFTGPLLSPTESRQLSLVAYWHDTDNVRSTESEPHVLTMHDPRPPAQLTVPDVLLYSGRPDVTGLSIAEHGWNPAPGQSSFAVYYSDENRVMAYLDSPAAGSPGAALRGQLATTADPAARATLLRANAGLLPAHLFERLRDVTDETGAMGARFRHAVSGSLRVLNLYRISAESASSARVDLVTLPLLIFAVPNADPPARPTLEVVSTDMTDNRDVYAATIRITLTPGMTEAAMWRLRRSSVSARDPLRMPIVTLGAMGPVDDDGRQRATVSDTGPVQISDSATLKPWVRYQWVAETQGAPAPGSVAAGRTVPAVWSAPSDPVSLMLVPPRAPDPVQTLLAAGTAVGGGRFSDVVLTFTHADQLNGASAGAYKVQVTRRDPGGVMQLLGESALTAGDTFAVSGLRTDLATGDPPDEPAAGTLYRVVLIDPLGRKSAAVETTLS